VGSSTGQPDRFRVLVDADIVQKLRLTSRAELVRYALAEGLLDVG
jgi:hypothetical protein